MDENQLSLIKTGNELQEQISVILDDIIQQHAALQEKIKTTSNSAVEDD